MRRPPQYTAAVNAFIDRKTEIDRLLATLAHLSEEHFNTDPDAVHWGHVGTLEHYRGILTDLCDSALATFASERNV